MTLRELKLILSNAGSRHFRLELPDGPPVPVSFHVTEVGLVRKTFIDCGGTLRESTACQLQVWVGEDVDHRLEARKAAQILDKARSFLTDESIPVEIEYEDRVISQYTVEGRRVDSESVVLKLAHKHTECLAPELCGLPAGPAKAGSATAPSSCCGTTGCC
ncbi:MAG: hypothetical protein JWM59_3512 [Verrucomicrobiales bacterium]|nr:hypothetical protein [Verrucomicrobiales bacterium]